MNNVQIKNVTLAYTRCMLEESKLGGWYYMFIVNRDKWVEAVQKALRLQEDLPWETRENTSSFILERTAIENVSGFKQLMSTNDVVVKVVSSSSPIYTDEKQVMRVGKGTKANINVEIKGYKEDRFGYGEDRNKKITVVSHADKGITVRVTELVGYLGEEDYFPSAVK